MTPYGRNGRGAKWYKRFPVRLHALLLTSTSPPVSLDGKRLNSPSSDTVGLQPYPPAAPSAPVAPSRSPLKPNPANGVTLHSPGVIRVAAAAADCCAEVRVAAQTSIIARSTAVVNQR